PAEAPQLSGMAPPLPVERAHHIRWNGHPSSRGTGHPLDWNPHPELDRVRVHDFQEKKTDVNLAADLIAGAWIGDREQRQKIITRAG
ncbi:hypothetical protein, partial [Halorhodospira abdelmalekii]|uniref:hypothetical protein n=1 Tax=Halorhodospira abdelmalekii TaxID=421629 RepID=UPI001A93621F